MRYGFVIDCGPDPMLFRYTFPRCPRCGPKMSNTGFGRWYCRKCGWTPDPVKGR